MFYSKLANKILTGRVVHPITGEVYGGTDFDNPSKLAELEAEPITVETVPDGYRAVSWSVVNVGGAYVYRPTTEAIPALTDGEKVALRKARYIVEADPHLHAAIGYDMEAAAEEDPTAKAAIVAKATSARENYLAVKTLIRQQIAYSLNVEPATNEGMNEP
jgi:hypothetical protein